MRSTISAAMALSLALAGCGDVTPTSVASDIDPVKSVAANGDLPRVLDAVHPRFRTPHIAEIVGAAIVVVAVALFDVRGAIGFSSANVLTYYVVANASALTLPGGWSPARLAGVVGLIGCVTLAVMLPGASVIGGAVVLAIGMAGWFAKERLAPGAGAATG